MKYILLLFITIFTLENLSAQDEQKYLDEAYALIKIKSFNADSDAKKCDVYAYLRAGNRSKQASYYVEFKRKATNELLFRDLINLNNLEAAHIAKSFREKDDVYELYFGLWLVHEDTYMEIIAIENGKETIIPVDYINYKNPITIMN